MDAYDYAMAFFDRFYRPEHTTLLVVGDVEPEPTFETVVRHWGGWEPGTLPRPDIEPEPEELDLDALILSASQPNEAAPAAAQPPAAQQPAYPDGGGYPYNQPGGGDGYQQPGYPYNQPGGYPQQPGWLYG